MMDKTIPEKSRFAIAFAHAIRAQASRMLAKTVSEERGVAEAAFLSRLGFEPEATAE